nr:HAMP domain-containing sensor histidine kinase [Tumebacillus amylolyticus]
MASGGSLDKLKPYRDLHSEWYIVQIFDDNNHELLFLKGKNPTVPGEVRLQSTKRDSVLANNVIQEEIETNDQNWLRVGAPILLNDDRTYALYLTLPEKIAIPRVNRQFGWAVIQIVGVALAGWIVIYFLSKRLTRPLRQLARAARQIAEGGYDPVLPEGVKEQELQQLLVSFRDMASRLKQLEQMRTDLLAGVSHELRTPLTSIRGMIQAVQSKVVTDEEAEEFLQISLDESKRLQSMVEQLLHVSAIQTGAQEFSRETVDLISLVEEVIQQLSVLPTFASVQFERNLPPAPVWVSGDAGALRQILLNLLNNSKHARPTSVTPLTIRLTAQAVGGQVLLDVADNGTGIPPEEQLYIFERFYRGQERPRGSHGLGLGLTLSRLLARGQGGDLLLIKSSEQGTTFRLLMKKTPPH